MLAILIGILLLQFITQVDTTIKVQDIPTLITTGLAFAAVIIILLMPLRDPNLPNAETSAPFDPPTEKLRSPEDRLALWQFMTVAWMTPLISMGSKRQLNDEDIWSLGLEFQHRGLHTRFRELKGSVVRRLLKANGLDLVISSFLAILEVLTSMMDTRLPVIYTLTFRQASPYPCFYNSFSAPWKVPLPPAEHP